MTFIPSDPAVFAVLAVMGWADDRLDPGGDGVPPAACWDTATELAQVVIAAEQMVRTLRTAVATWPSMGWRDLGYTPKQHLRMEAARTGGSWSRQ